MKRLAGRPIIWSVLPRRVVVLAAATDSLGCRDAGDRALRTTILSPAAGGDAFEPSIAIDPADPDRILVAAMYGVPFARGGAAIYVTTLAEPLP